MIPGLGGLDKNAGLLSKIIEFLTKNPMAKNLLQSLLEKPKSANELSTQLNLGDADVSNLIGQLKSVNAVEQTGDQFKITDLAAQVLKSLM
jgi:predicted transcriptional regulator